ncbi:hypothetical protein ACFWD3_07470, partial [Micrococcus luteus]|uniref:hypothetical protein n=1 Tax=Micrococcus luteus TaxID=1270 RepID=UPI0036628325
AKQRAAQSQARGGFQVAQDKADTASARSAQDGGVADGRTQNATAGRRRRGAPGPTPVQDRSSSPSAETGQPLGQTGLGRV